MQALRRFSHLIKKSRDIYKAQEEHTKQPLHLSLFSSFLSYISLFLSMHSLRLDQASSLSVCDWL